MSKVTSVDRTLIPIIEQNFLSICQSLSQRTQQAAYSPLTMVGDLGTAILDEKGQFVIQWQTSYTGGSHVAVQAMIDYIGRENIGPGDFIIGNDPYILAIRHLPDWSFLRPVFYKGELIFFLYFLTHQQDSGGAHQGGYAPGLADIHGEGVCIPPTKLLIGGKMNEDAARVIYRNVRDADMVRMDNLLVNDNMVKAEEQIVELCKTYGKDNIKAAMNESIRLTEKAVRSEISKWPAGTYYAVTAADCDGTTPDPVRVNLKLTVKPDAGELIFDFTDNPEQVNFINLGRGMVWGQTQSAVRWHLPEEGFSSNHGLYNAIKVLTKKGTVFDVQYPGTVGGNGPCLGAQIIELVQLALAQAVPTRATAWWTRDVNPPLTGVDRGHIDPRTGNPRFYKVCAFHSTGTSGAVWGYDGWESLLTPECGGTIVRGPIEPWETLSPIRWLKCEWMTDSSGQGKWRGGMGCHVEYLNEQAVESFRPGDAEVTSGNANGEKFPPLGVVGGTNGKKTNMWIKRKGKLIRFHTMSSAPMQPGDVLITQVGGGGGCGNPLEREVEKVREDALNGYISLKTARKIYGVVISPKTFEVNQKATTDLRNKMKRSKSYRERFVPPDEKKN